MSDLPFLSPTLIMSVQKGPFMGMTSGVWLSGKFSACSSSEYFFMRTDNTVFFQYGNVCECLLLGQGRAFQLE